ncbi:hypothetical protein AB0I95_10890 [Micromonospora sp. NPDC049751]|uniref:hypothetical protein n=1 Tax=Micromonospora sp. NPDC049751 TaxID=3154837 RepID=UPI0033DB8A4B
MKGVFTGIAAIAAQTPILSDADWPALAAAGVGSEPSPKPACPAAAVRFVISAGPVRRALIGDHTLTVDQCGDLRADRDNDRLIFRYDAAPRSCQTSPCAAGAGGAVLVTTDLVHYALAQVDDSGKPDEPFLVLTGEELSTLLDLSGGLWEIAYPRHWALLSSTLALDLPAAAPIVSVVPADHIAPMTREARALQALRGFSHLGTRLVDILHLHDRVTGVRAADAPSRRLDRSILHDLTPPRCELLDFTGSHERLSRPDAVSAYLDSEGETYCREYYLRPTDRCPRNDQLDRLAYAMLYLLGIRRTKLFRSSFRDRLYNVLLPCGVLIDPATNQPAAALVIAVTLHRLQDSYQFRQTCTFTTMLVPVDVGSLHGLLTARQASLHEIQRWRKALTSVTVDESRGPRFRLSGPLADYIRLDQADAHRIDRIIEIAVSRTMTGLAYQTDDEETGATHTAAHNALREASLTSVGLLTNWADGRNAWEEWCTGARDAALETVIFQTVFMEDFRSPRLAFASRKTVDLRSLSIGNMHGADMSGLTFFNPQDNCKYVLYPSAAEEFPNHSILRWLAWQVYMDVALTSMQAMLLRFHSQITAAADLRVVLRSVQEISREYSEVYDLELTDYFYRREFERLRALLKMDGDYEQMRKRLTAAQNESSLREQMLVNNLIVALTVSTISATILVAIGEAANWSPWTYVPWLLIGLSVAGFVTFGMFEPLRRLARRQRRRRLERRSGKF